MSDEPGPMSVPCAARAHEACPLRTDKEFADSIDPWRFCNCVCHIDGHWLNPDE